MIRLNNVGVSYRIGNRVVNAVQAVDLTIPDGCIVGIAGESGSGKSTLMKAIYGDIQAPMFLSSGSIDYGLKGSDGKPVTSENIRKEWFRTISYVPQSSMNSLNPVIRIGKQFVDFPAPTATRSACSTGPAPSSASSACRRKLWTPTRTSSRAACASAS